MELFRRKEGDVNQSRTAVKLDYKKYLAEIFLAVGIILLVSLVPLISKAYATEEFWDLKIGGDPVAVLSSEEDGTKVIESLEAYYTQDGAEDVSVKLDPKITVEQNFYSSDEAPKVLNVAETVQLILNGTEKVEEYTVKADDTLWDISQNKSLSLETLIALNSDKDLTVIKPGDKLNVSETKPLVSVTTTQTITASEDIAYETAYEESATLASGSTEVKTAGVVGVKNVTKTVTAVNGKVTEVKVITETVTKEPVTQVILKGTKAVSTRTSSTTSSSSSGGTVYAGSGQAVANFALQFVGNPYVYGGVSLTNGADCSGFVQSVYAHFGISLPRGAHSQGTVGRAVSYSEARPGDIVYFAKGHVGIYIGNGKMVHASEPRTGIIVTNLSYSGTPASFRRLVG